jgi:hypothetical protein
LARIPGLEDRDLLGMGFDGVGNFVQQCAALIRRPGRPPFKGLLGCTRRTVNRLSVAARDFGDHRPVDRRAGLERGGRVDALARNVMADAVRLQACQQGLEPRLIVGKRRAFERACHIEVPL